MTIADKVKVQAGVVNQSLLAVVQDLQAIEDCSTEQTTSPQEKLGIKTQLYARVDFHMGVARKAFQALEEVVAVKR